MKIKKILENSNTSTSHHGNLEEGALTISKLKPKAKRLNQFLLTNNTNRQEL